MANNGVLDWGDVIQNDDQGYEVLPEGDYVFSVTKFERGSFPGSAKLPKCNKAVLTLDVQGHDIRAELILHTKLEWKIASFFRCIGLKKKGEKLSMDWNKVQGREGRAHITIREYTGRDGQKHEVNDVGAWLDPDDRTFAEESNGELPWETAGV